MTVAFFAEGSPRDPGLVLGAYKRTLVAVGPDAGPDGGPPVWRLDTGNLHLLERAMTELGARGVTRLHAVLPSLDVAHDETDVLDEGAFVPTLRRLLTKRPGGVALRLELSSGRPYVPPPPSLDISTNDLCGLKCVMCGNRNRQRDPLTMSPEDVGALLHEAAGWGIRRVALTGSGEPFRDPALLGHVDAAHALSHLVTITTNGFPVTEAVAERLAAVHASISVSIHGAADETHDRITGVPTSAAHAWRAVRRLVAAREKAGARGRLSVNVSTVIQRGNVEEIEALVRRSKDEGCDGHNLQPVNLQHGSFQEGAVVRRDDAAAMAALWPAPEQAPALDRLFDRLVARREDYPHVRTTEARLRLVRRYFTDSSREALGVACGVGESFLGVDHRGRVKPCYRLPWSLGDARLRKVRKLWNSVAYAAVRRTVDACPLTCLNNCFFRKAI